MFQQLSRRSVLKIASGASFVAGCVVAGCSSEESTDPTIKTGNAKTVEESTSGPAGKKETKAPPSPTQRVKGGPE
jgi:outer membrane murein-binding lipoprotein Lpp